MKTFVRWIVRGVVGLVAVVAVWLLVATLWQLHAAHRDAARYPAAGRFANLGGQLIYVYCIGQGSPTVVLESGLAGPTVLWQQVQPAVARTTRVCSYDRDGVGRSGESGQPRTTQRFADDLHRALAGVGETGPFVIAGHSIGGMLALDYARAYPDDVAGVVLLDPTNPKQFARGEEQWKEHNQMLPYFHLAPAMAKLGLVREALWAGDKLKPLPLPETLRKEFIALDASPKGMNALRAEADALFFLCQSSLDFPNLDAKPLIVLSASKTLDEGFPVAYHTEMAALSSAGVHRVVPNASHAGLVLNPVSAQSVIAAIVEVVDSVRAH